MTPYRAVIGLAGHVDHGKTLLIKALTGITTARAHEQAIGMTQDLGFAHFDNFGLPFSVLRYFSVYGPGQRPDMAYHRFLEKAKTGDTVTVYGDGEQRRTNTYVGDCVNATISAIDKATPGQAYNISGTQSSSINEALQTMREVTGAVLPVDYQPARAGDQRETRGDISKAQRELGYAPVWSLRDGLAAQWEWQKNRSFPTA